MSGYTSDFNDEQRQREYDRQEAHRININLWPEQMADNRAGQQLACEYCSIVLVIRGNDWFCSGCGSRRSIEDKPKPRPRRFKPKQASGVNPLIVASQPNRRKKRPGTEGDLELRKDLALMGQIDESSVYEY